MTILTGDCLDVMKTFPDNHFSAIVTDPPYGLSFMGKGWDHEVPNQSYWKECYRISKHGSFLVAMGGTRTFHRLACAIEDSGYELRDCISWLYGSGFPKSHNRFGFEGYGTALKPAWEPCILAMKPCDGTFRQNAEKWGQAGLNIDGCRITANDHPGVHFAGNSASGSLNWNVGEKRGSGNEYHIPKGRWPANVILDEESAKLVGEQSRFFYIARNSDSDIISACESHEESLSFGSKTENGCNNLSIVSFGNKPMGLFLPDTISIIKMGTHSIINFPILSVSKQKLIGNCTLESEKIISQSMALSIESVSIAENGNFLICFQNELMEPIKGIVRDVRHNACLSGGKVTGNTGTNTTEIDGKGQEIDTIKNILIKIANESMQGVEKDTLQKNPSSRFFYCAKASSSERNEGLDGLPTRQTMGGGGTNNTEDDVCGKYGSIKAPQKNCHPTVKPLKLMEYLIKLVMPPKDGLLLDPFAGSGTTILAAKRLGYPAIGIEKSEEYSEIARARIASIMI